MAFIEKSYDVDELSLSITIGGEEKDYDLNQLSAEMRNNLTCHGASQKLGDATASVKKSLAEKLGREPTDDELRSAAREAVDSVWSQLLNGDWRAARGEGEAKPRVGEVALAIARLQSISVEEAQALVAQVDKEKLAKWRAHPQMKLAIAQIRQEKAEARLKAELAKAGQVEAFNPNA